MGVHGGMRYIIYIHLYAADLANNRMVCVCVCMCMCVGLIYIYILLLHHQINVLQKFTLTYVSFQCKDDLTV